MGNPTSYLGKTLTWEGKQLKALERSMGNSSVQYSYEYDENGLRTQKTYTVNGVYPRTTSYYYNGSVLIGIEMDGDFSAKVMRFSYDASGNVAAVDYSADGGSTFNTYYYVRNARNGVCPGRTAVPAEQSAAR